MRIKEIYTYPDSHVTFQGRSNVRHFVESDAGGKVNLGRRVRMTLVQPLPGCAFVRIEKEGERTSHVPLTSIMEVYFHEEEEVKPQQRKTG